jgi:hypothetical protein
MSEEYDNTNQGAMFAPISQQILRQGTVNVNGSDHHMMIVKQTSKDGIPFFNLYLGVAKIYETEKKKDTDSDMDGSIRGEHLNGADMKFWLRKKTSAKGTDYTSISLAPKKTSNGLADNKETSLNDMEKTSTDTTLDDEIPF